MTVLKDFKSLGFFQDLIVVLEYLNSTMLVSKKNFMKTKRSLGASLWQWGFAMAPQRFRNLGFFSQYFIVILQCLHSTMLVLTKIL